MPFTVYVKKRPGVDVFMTELAKYYELVIFTASIPEVTTSSLTLSTLTQWLIG